MTAKKRTAIIFTLGGLSALTPFSIDMYLPAFPNIASSLETDIAHVSFSLTGFFIGISAGQLLYGPVTDKWGRRKPLFFGLLIFCLAAIGCAYAPSVYWLIGLRVILAFGCAAAMVTATAAIKDLFPIAEVARIFSALMLILGLGPIVAPPLGGMVLTTFSWQHIFYFLSAFSMVLIILVYGFLPERTDYKSTKRLTMKNVIGNYASVMNNNSFMFYALAGSTAMAGMFAYITSSAGVFIQYFKFTPVQYSLIFSFNGMGFIVGSQLNRILLNKYTSLKIIYSAGLLILMVSICLLLLSVTMNLAPVILIALIFLYMFSIGLILPNCAALAMSSSSNNAGVASALLGALQMSLSAISSCLVSSLFNGTAFPMVLMMFISAAVCVTVLFCLYRRTSRNR